MEKCTQKIIDEIYGGSFDNFQDLENDWTMFLEPDFLKVDTGYFLIIRYCCVANNNEVFTADYKRLGDFIDYYDNDGVYAYSCPDDEPGCRIPKSQQTHYDVKGNVIK